MTDFVHLHVHSDFSLTDSAASVTGLADKAEKLGMKYLALTDHGNMFGAMEFIAACNEAVEDYIDEKGKPQKRNIKRKNPIKPIIGCEVYVSPGSRFEKKGSESENRYYHLILLAANRTGYLNLVKLCSFAYTEGFYYRPRIDEELLVKYSGGLIALSACVSGEIPQLIRAGKIKEAEDKARYYRDLFGCDENGNPNFYLEIQDHGIPAERLKGSLSQSQINDALTGISVRTGIPLAASNDVHYLDQDDAAAHDALLCIGTGKLRSDEKRKQYYRDQFYFKSGDEMAALFSGCPEAIANTVRIAERCDADIPIYEAGEVAQFLPEFEIPEGYENADAYLKSSAFDGLAKRYKSEKDEGKKPWDDICKRAEFELDTIIKMGFTGYFLIVADFINWAKEHGIPVGPGRGSGAGSITAYALRITDINPLKYGLLFERFLNPERISMPDFDVDFANEGRERVIKYVTEKYGQERVGQIITFGTLGAKAVIKDVARVLGISIPESDMITKLIPKDPKITLSIAIKNEAKLRELEEDARYTELFSLARKLEGLNRHSSIHAAGIVIGKSILHDFVPLYQERDDSKSGKAGSIATQYTMNFLEQCGLVKMDFLGLKTLDVIKHTEELIRSRGGKDSSFSIENIPDNDEAVFKMLGEGRSFEVFQFESDGMKNILRQAKPGSIEDLTALNSLYRPGPMDNIPQFIESKNGRQAISYPDPSLEEALKETYGVIVYQEQVMQVARIIAGYSMGQADLLRRAMGKKIMEKMVKEKVKFIDGAKQRGYSEKKAGEIFELLIPFAGYGFNKSHAAAYSVLAYQTAYLKANFSAEFMAANLTNEINSADKDKLSECIAESRRMGFSVDPPDINNSHKLFTVVGGRIAYGFVGIKGIGDGPADEIINCRKEGPYRNFMDFLERVDIKAVGKSVIEKLIQTGAFDSFGVARESLQGNLERAVDYVQNIKDEKKFGQVSLFGETSEKEYPDFIFETFPLLSRQDKLKLEKELIGFYFSGHPLDEYRQLWEKAVKVDLSRPDEYAGIGCILVGLIKSIKTFISKKGGKMAFGVIEDYNGEIEVTFFSEAWNKYESKIEVDKVAILKGKIDYQKDKEKRSFVVDECMDAANAEAAIEEDETQNRKWDKYRNIWKYSKSLDLRLLDLSAASAAEPGNYTVLGILKSLRTHIDKNGNEMAFGTLQDNRGQIDLLFFSKTWEKAKDIAAVDEIVALNGSIDPVSDKDTEKNKNRQNISFRVSSLQDINKLVRSAAKAAAANIATNAVASNAAAADTAVADGEVNAAETKNAAAGNEADNGEKNEYKEFHIRLRSGAVKGDASLFPLLDCIRDKPGACSVFIHVKTDRGEKVILAENKISSSLPIEILNRCAAVAHVWGA
ncbi:MAG: DNA polymerase III subunit alpha [Treponema sp.]|jgi:DNA polymerase-3 subunit alpha|nr:DNA polymerase III subunit alpha [Treponema sp.]